MRKARVSKGDRKDNARKRQTAGFSGRADLEKQPYWDSKPVASGFSLGSCHGSWRLTQLIAGLLIGALVSYLVLKSSVSYGPTEKGAAGYWHVSNALQREHLRAADEAQAALSDPKRPERLLSGNGYDLRAQVKDERAADNAIASRAQALSAEDKQKAVSGTSNGKEPGPVHLEGQSKDVGTAEEKEEFRRVPSVTQTPSNKKLPRARKDGFFVPDAKVPAVKEEKKSKNILSGVQQGAHGSNHKEEANKVGTQQSAKGAGGSLLDLFLGDSAGVTENQRIINYRPEDKTSISDNKTPGETGTGKQVPAATPVKLQKARKDIAKDLTGAAEKGREPGRQNAEAGAMKEAGKQSSQARTAQQKSVEKERQEIQDDRPVKQLKSPDQKDEETSLFGDAQDAIQKAGKEILTDLKRLAAELTGKPADDTPAHSKGHLEMDAQDETDASQSIQLEHKYFEASDEEPMEEADLEEAGQAEENEFWESEVGTAQQQVQSGISTAAQSDFLRMQEDLMPELRKEIEKATAAMAAGSEVD